jgi:hypothetical protein
MSANVTIAPYQTTVGNAGLFNVSSVGLRQGTAYPDPSSRWRLRGGILANSETLPMWGGVGVYMNVPNRGSGNTGPSTTLGVQMGRATALTGGSKNLAGFSVFDQAYAMITSPQSPVPLAGSLNHVNAYAFGSQARIAVACDPILADLEGGPIGASVSWDFVNQLLVPYLAAYTVNSTGSAYNNTSGIVSLTLTTAYGGSPGDSIVVSSLTGSSISGQNGTYTVLSVSGDVITYQAAASLGATTITGGTVTPGSGSDVAIPVEVLDVQVTNCETVSYNPTTGFATWNFNGACAIIAI